MDQIEARRLARSMNDADTNAIAVATTESYPNIPRMEICRYT